MLVWIVLFVLLLDAAWFAIGRYSTQPMHPIHPRQPVSCVSSLRRTNNKCELLRTHNRNTVSCLRPTSIEGARPGL
jgi:hypothetical protein